jgi:hypothetical protein
VRVVDSWNQLPISQNGIGQGDLQARPPANKTPREEDDKVNASEKLQDREGIKYNVRYCTGGKPHIHTVSDTLLHGGLDSLSRHVPVSCMYVRS